MTEVGTKPESQAKEKSIKQSRAQSLREKLAAVEAQAKTLRDKVREEERKEREDNARAIVQLLRSEELDGFGIEAWRIATPQIKALLEKADT